MKGLTPTESGDQATPAAGTITETFATPVARISCPFANDINEQLERIVIARLNDVENHFEYKAETAPNMAEWGEAVVDRVSTWVVRLARQFTEKVIGRALEEAFSYGNYNDKEPERPLMVSVGIGRSWASIYREGDSHDPHFHPNTALSAIYYVCSPASCDLDLVDPRTNIGHFDPGITLGGEGHNVRLHCRPGELVMFPGWLKHAVPRVTHSSPRISLSWNLGYAVQEA